jgi:hypothetical protein
LAQSLLLLIITYLFTDAWVIGGGNYGLHFTIIVVVCGAAVLAIQPEG